MTTDFNFKLNAYRFSEFTLFFEANATKRLIHKHLRMSLSIITKK